MCTCMAGNKIQGVIKKSTAHELSVSTGKSINCSYKVLLFVFAKKAWQPAFSPATEVPAA